MTSVEKYLSYEPKDELDLQTLRKTCEGILKIRDFVPIHPKAILHLIDQLEAAQKDAARWNALSPAARSVLSERERQINAEGWTAETDDAYNRGVLSDAGASYALHAYNSQRSNEVPEDWPWSEEWWKPSESARRNLEKAGALILAEIESFDRVSAISKS